MFLEFGQHILKKHNPLPEADLFEWKGISLPQGPLDFTPFYSKERRSNYFPLWVEIEREDLSTQLLGPNGTEFIDLKRIKEE